MALARLGTLDRPARNRPPDTAHSRWANLGTLSIQMAFPCMAGGLLPRVDRLRAVPAAVLGKWGLLGVCRYAVPNIHKT